MKYCSVYLISYLTSIEGITSEKAAVPLASEVTSPFWLTSPLCSVTVSRLTSNF